MLSRIHLARNIDVSLANVMRTDAFDRFCTALEHRFTRQQIENMLLKAGLCDIRFSDHEPFWCAVGFKCTPLPRND